MLQRDLQKRRGALGVVLGTSQYRVRRNHQRSRSSRLVSNQETQSLTMADEKNYNVSRQRIDLFISHASEDKDSIARPLYQALIAYGFSVWFDEAELRIGDSLRRRIDDGLAKCRYGIVILSPSFLAKDWPKRELDGLVARETSTGQTAILPVWHNLDSKILMKYSPTLADRIAVRSGEGVTRIVDEVRRTLIQTSLQSQEDWVNYLYKALRLETSDQTLPSFLDEDIITTMHSYNGPDLNKLEDLANIDFTTILLLYGDEGVNLRHIAYWVASQGIFCKLNKHRITPIYIKTDSKCILNDEIKRSLQLLQHPMSSGKIRQSLAERKLLPIVDCSPGMIEEQLLGICNGFTSSFAILIWNNPSLPCLTKLQHKRVYHASCFMDRYIRTRTSRPAMNLPQKNWDHFVGRVDEQRVLKRLMSLECHHTIVTVKGMSGVGKTELVLKVAHELGNQSESEYDFILFFTAKKQQLLSSGSIRYSSNETESFKTLDDLCEKISSHCGQILTMLPRSEQEAKLAEYFNSGEDSLLVLIDNYETIDPLEQQRIHSFFRNLEKTARVKIIINARVWHPVDLCLEPLTANDALVLTSLFGINLKLSDAEIEKIVLVSQQLPLAIIWIISLIREGNTVSQIIESKIKQYDNNGILSYMFQDLLDSLQATDPWTYTVFQMMSITQFALSESDIQKLLIIEDSNKSLLHESLKKLVEYSLCTSQGDRYSLRTLAREYGVNILKNDTDHEANLRDKLISHIVCLAKDNGGDDRGSYRDKYDILNTYWDNIKELFEILQASWKNDLSNAYFDAKQLWKALQRFTYLYGKWSVREKWTSALILEANIKGDSIFCAELIAANGWISLMREGDVNIKNACQSFEESLAMLIETEVSDGDRKLHDEATLTIYLNLAAAKIRQYDFPIAKNTLYMFISLWRQRTNTRQRMFSIENRSINRFYIRYLLYRGEYFYRKDMPWRAERYYSLVDTLCEKIDWTRFRAKANERIAYLKIQSEDPSEAKKAHAIIRHWGNVNIQNGDKRRSAFFMKDEALLWKRYGSHTVAKTLAKSAHNVFKELGMVKRQLEMNELINSISPSD